MTRIGIIGLSHDHVWDVLPGVVAHENAELVAAASAQLPLLERAKKEFGMATYPDAAEMAAGESLDAVYIYGNNRAGAEEGVKALERGWHVLIEKPLAADLEGARQMLQVADSTGQRLMVNWPTAWWAPLREALALAQAGDIGELWQVKYRAAHEGPKEMGASEYFCDWLYDPQRNGGGAFIDYCCYGAILSRILLGRAHSVTAVSANLVKRNLDAEDNGILLMQYPNALGIAEASWTQMGKLTSYVTAIYGTEGTLLVEPENGRLFKATAKHLEGREVAVPESPAHLADPTAHFLWGIKNDEAFQPMCRPGNNVDAQEMLAAGIEAAASGTRIELPQFEEMD